MNSSYLLAVKKIRLAVLDMAGTTVEDKDFVAQALVQAFRTKGMEITVPQANAKMGLPKPEAIRELVEENFFISPDARLVEDLFAEFESIMCRFYAEEPGIIGKPGSDACFLQLKAADIRVFLDTGFSRRVADVVLNRLGWLQKGLIDGSVASDEVAHGRPHPDLIFKAMELVGITDASEVAKVGDTISDLWEGTRAGCALVIGITSGAQGASELQSAPHTHLCATLAEAAHIITSFPQF